MRWQWFLISSILLSFPAWAQQPQQGNPGKPIPAPTLGIEAASGPHTSPTYFTTCPGASQDSLLTGNRNFPNFIGFLSNPLQNIEPRALTQICPIFGSTWTSALGPLPSADFQVYGAGLKLALSERLSVGLNQGGYAGAHFRSRNSERQGPLRDQDFGGSRQGFLNLGGYFQYTLIQDVPNQFLLTGGLRWIAPAGSYEMFQGHGPLELAPYLTLGQELGDYHVLATTGYQFPAGPGSDNNKFLYANMHLDRRLFGWLYPLVEFNFTYHVSSVGLDRLPRQGFIDFGNFESSGNILTLAVGANAVLVQDRLEIGAVYITPLATQNDFDFNGMLVKMILRY